MPQFDPAELTPHDVACLEAIVAGAPREPHALQQRFGEAAAELRQYGRFTVGGTEHIPENPEGLAALLRQMAGTEALLSDLAELPEGAARPHADLAEELERLDRRRENPKFRREIEGADRLLADLAALPEHGDHEDAARRRIGPRTGHRAPETPHDRISEVEGGRGAGGDENAPRSKPRVE